LVQTAMIQRRTLRTCAAATAAMCALLAIAPATLAQAPQSSEADRSTLAQRCRDLFTQGFEAINASQFERARQILTEAMSDCPSYDVAGALGQAELELKRYRDAAEHLDYAITHFPPGESRELLARTKEGLERAKKHVATLRVAVNQPGAEILVDDRRVGISPLKSDLFVEPGAHRVRAAKEGTTRAEQGFEVQAGQSLELTLDVDNAGSPAPGAPTDDPGAAPSTGDAALNHGAHSAGVPPRTIVLIGGGALTAVLLGVAGVYHLRGNSADDDAGRLRTQARTELGSNCSEGSGHPTCRELADTLDRRNTSNTIATVSLIGAGASAAATAVLFLLLPEKPKPTTVGNLRFSVGASRQDATVSVGGVF
jgi:hypothetical protein